MPEDLIGVKRYVMELDPRLLADWKKAAADAGMTTKEWVVAMVEAGRKATEGRNETK
ncbi:MAG: hypothetical protein ACYC41_13480 [Bacillota bacterium]